MWYKVKKIYQWSNLVRPIIPPFTPWANTVAYYPFESNINDASWNNRNLSMYTGSFSYQTLSSWKKICRFNTSALAKIGSIPFNRTAYTVSAWCSWDTISSSYQKIILDLVEWSNYRPRYFAYWSEVTWLVSSEWSWVSYVQNQWYHILVTYTNWVARMYINNTLKATYTLSTSGTAWKMLINGTDSNNYNVNYRTAGTISELILENKVWTDTEISNYYNNTKSNYGL